MQLLAAPDTATPARSQPAPSQRTGLQLAIRRARVHQPLYPRTLGGPAPASDSAPRGAAHPSHHESLEQLFPEILHAVNSVVCGCSEGGRQLWVLIDERADHRVRAWLAPLDAVGKVGTARPRLGHLLANITPADPSWALLLLWDGTCGHWSFWSRQPQALRS